MPRRCARWVICEGCATQPMRLCGVGDDLQCAQGVLASGGDVAANAVEDDPLFTAEQSRYFLLHLNHTKIPFGQFVVEVGWRSYVYPKTSCRCAMLHG